MGIDALVGVFGGAGAGEDEAVGVLQGTYEAVGLGVKDCVFPDLVAEFGWKG